MKREISFLFDDDINLQEPSQRAPPCASLLEYNIWGCVEGGVQKNGGFGEGVAKHLLHLGRKASGC